MDRGTSSATEEMLKRIGTMMVWLYRAYIALEGLKASREKALETSSYRIARYNSNLCYSQADRTKHLANIDDDDNATLF